MKKIGTLALLTAIILSCGKELTAPSKRSLQEQKELLSAQIDSLNKALNAVEKALSAVDTDQKLSSVTTLPAKKDVFKRYLNVQATATAEKDILLRPELGGTVQKIWVTEGQTVKEGQTLIQLDDAAVKNAMEELRTQLALAKTTFERQERLWKQKIGSEIQFLQAKTQKEALEKSLKGLQTQANKMKITAPFNGVVDEIFPKKGELTNPQFPVLRLMDLTHISLEAEVTESFISKVKKGTEVAVYFPALEREISARIDQVGRYINPENRSFKVSIPLSNKDRQIKPNLLANLKILTFEAEGIVVPSSLVQQDQKGASYVFVVTKEKDAHRIVKKPIVIGSEYAQQTYVSQGLDVNERLVNEGARLVKAGEQVHIIQE